jgi:hypothetical protein
MRTESQSPWLIVLTEFGVSCKVTFCSNKTSYICGLLVQLQERGVDKIAAFCSTKLRSTAFSPRCARISSWSKALFASDFDGLLTADLDNFGIAIIVSLARSDSRRTSSTPGPWRPDFHQSISWLDSSRKIQVRRGPFSIYFIMIILRTKILFQKRFSVSPFEIARKQYDNFRPSVLLDVCPDAKSASAVQTRPLKPSERKRQSFQRRS